MKLLVTGSRGFVGGSVGQFAAEAGHDVLGVARSSQPDTEWSGRHIQADILHASLTSVIEDFAPDVVLHAAGAASVAASLSAPLDDLRAAVFTWANTLDSIRRSSIRPLILFPSSAAIYGAPAILPVAEDAPVAPVSPYGFHKAACELIGREYAECFGLNIVACRLFSIFGPRQRRLLVWEIFEQLSGPAQTVWLNGTGRESRDYLHSADLADLFLKLATHPALARAEGTLRAVNLGAGCETSILDLAQEMNALLGLDKLVACRGAAQTGNPSRWSADITRLRALLPDWRPTALADGLSQCMKSWQAFPPN